MAEKNVSVAYLLPKELELCGRTYTVAVNPRITDNEDILSMNSYLQRIVISTKSLQQPVHNDTMLISLWGVILRECDRALGKILFQDDTADKHLTAVAQGIHMLVKNNHWYRKQRMFFTRRNVEGVRITMGPYHYTVMCDPEFASGIDAYAGIQACLQTMALFSAPSCSETLLTNAHVFQTFIHELLHIVDFDAGALLFKKTYQEKSEDYIDALAYKLAGVLMQNGWVVATDELFGSEAN